MRISSVYTFSNLSRFFGIQRDPLLYRYESFLNADAAVIHKVRELGNDPRRCYRFVVENIRYMSDRLNYGTEEFWARPGEVLRRMSGDCEDTAFLIASMFMVIGIECFVRTAYLIEYGSGHAWCYFRWGGQWVPAETTSSIFDPWAGPSRWPYYGPYIPFIDIRRGASHNYSGAELLKRALRIRAGKYMDGQVRLDGDVIRRKWKKEEE